MKCENCGENKIVVTEEVTGFPDYRVAGSKQEYCSVCDEIPQVELDTTKMGYVLEENI